MKKLFVVGLVFLALGCVQVNSYVKPDVDFSKIKRIAIVRLTLQDTQPSTMVESQVGLLNIESNIVKESQQGQSISQIVNDMLMTAFANKGLNVVEKAQFTESERQTFFNEGVEAIIHGTILTIKESGHTMKISLSLKMLDLKSNKLIWSASVLGQEINDLDEVTHKIVATIP